MKPGEEKSPAQPASPTREFELGVPIAGNILPSELWAKTAIKRLPSEGRLDWETVFGRQAKRVLDIGCGNGRFIISSAVNRPEIDHIGIDILPVVIRYATRRGNQRGLHNTRFAVCDGEAFLQRFAGPSSLFEIHLYHPQPVHLGDAKDPGARILQPAFIGLVHDALTDGGRFFLQTDSRPYWEYMKSIVPRLFDWREQIGPWPEDPLGRTRREIQAGQRGLQVFRAEAVKSKNLSPDETAAIIAELPPPSFLSDRRRTRRIKRRRA